MTRCRRITSDIAEAMFTFTDDSYRWLFDSYHSWTIRTMDNLYGGLHYSCYRLCISLSYRFY